MKKEIHAKMQQNENYRVQADVWPQIPKSFRQYEQLEDFVMSSDREGFKKEIERVLTAKKTHKCEFNCACSQLEKLGPYLHDKQTWDSSCPGRACK